MSHGGNCRQMYKKKVHEQFGECPDHGKSLECKESRVLKHYKRRRFHCMKPLCKYRETTVEVFVPAIVTRDRRSGIDRFVRRMISQYE